MSAGTYISVIGHAGLIGWALVGTSLQAPQKMPEATVTEIAIISSDVFELMLAEMPPDVGVVSAAAQPNITIDTTANVALSPDTVPDRTDQSVVQSSDPDALPTRRPLPLPRPQINPLDAPLPSVPDVDVTATDPGTISTPPQPADRVASTPVAPAPPDVDTGDTPQIATQPAQDPGTTTEVVENSTAPEAATTEIVTEPETQEARTAPTQSLRPQSRPPVERVVETQPDPVPTVDSVTSALEQALAEAAEFEAQQSTPSVSGTLTQAEIQGLQFAIQQCWNVGSLSSDALSTTVVVRFDMSPDARPILNTIQLIGQNGGTAASAQQAFEAARRAIVRCGTQGYGLPEDLYDVWKTIEMTFNPERMRIK
ncbi:MAG: energy transducer TonB [Pseudomonadota bacterium]